MREENIAKFFELVDLLPEIKKGFHYLGKKPVINNDPKFTKWSADIKIVLQKIKNENKNHSECIGVIVSTLDKMKGWHDDRDFSNVATNCLNLKKKIEEEQKVIQEKQKEVQEEPIKKIFIVHGHDIDKRNDVELFIRRLGFSPVILENEPNGGKTVIEKFEECAEDVSFVIVLYTACDMGKPKNEKRAKPRARQNVVFEHGFFYAKLGRKKVVALHEAGVEIPSDLSGVLYISLGKDWKNELKRELKNAGFSADWTKS